jgi:UPF0716 protein FxsA
MPSQELQDGLMIVFAAALLLTPGLLTDALGFVMLTPVGRRLVRKHLLGRIAGGVKFQVYRNDGNGGGQPLNRRYQHDSKTIDAEVVHKEIP